MELPRQKQTGNPKIIEEKWYRRAALLEKQRFWGFVIKTKSCWLWDGPQQGDGYGILSIAMPNKGSKALLAHRLSYYLNKGTFPESMFVCHTCDVPRCVNPDHLFLGTVTENNQDKIKKGRHRGWSKEAILSGISEEEADFLKRKYKSEMKAITERKAALYGETA